MITHPTADELLVSAGRWIEEIRPQLDERNAFLARVAQNALALVGRELAQGALAEASAAARLSSLLGRQGEPAELVHAVCEALRRGEMDASTPGLIAALKANALDRLAIDQPSYKHGAA